MILAAGRGERLQPLSDFLPKPAMPLPNGPLIASALRLAARVSTRIVVNSWWLPEKLESAALKVKPSTASLEFSREEIQMETAGGLALARDRGLLGSEGPILVINGDGILNLELEPLFEGHLRRSDQVTLALLPHLDPTRWSRIHLDASGGIATIRPPGAPSPGEVPFLYPGVMLISREALNTLETRPSGVSTTLWRQALKHHAMGGVVLSGHWREVGNPGDYLEAVLSQTSGRVFCHASAHIAQSAELNNSFVGRNCRIEGGCRLEDSSLSEGVTLGKGVFVRNSILLGPLDIPEGRILDGVVLAPIASDQDKTSVS